MNIKSTIVGNTALNFGEALEALQTGKKVQRQGWNGKGMFLQMIKENEWSIPNTSIVPEKVFPLAAFIGMKTADDKFVPWLASQTDILSSDWQVILFYEEGKFEEEHSKMVESGKHKQS